MYIEMSKRQNDFHRPNRKDTHAVAWQTLIKLRTLWNAYGRPKPKEVRDVEKQGDMLMCMVVVLNLKLDAQKNLNITKLSSKLNDWISHACKEDDEAFEDLIRIEQEMDAHILHQDLAKEVAWNKFMMKKKENEKAKEPRHVPMTINWLRPFRGLQEEDFKELVHMALYDHKKKRQRLYFHDVDKPYPERHTIEYVSVRLRQRYVVRTTLQWLQIEGSSAIYKKMEDFVKIDVTRFGDHDTLVALGQLGTRSFISHWSSQLYVSVTALKKYAHEIPTALRTHHRDIVKGGSGFLGKVKVIGDQAYAVSGWLWKTKAQEHVQGYEEVREVEIMHRGGLFTGGIGELGEPALWVLDCQWGGKEGDKEAWTYEEYETAMEVMGKWMHACPRWNVALLCPEGKDMRSLVRELERPDRIIRHGS